MAIAVFASVASSRYYTRTVVIEFITKANTTDKLAALNRLNANHPADIVNVPTSGFTVEYIVHYAKYPVGGIAWSDFGYNAMLARSVTPTNYPLLDGYKTNLTYRSRPFLWWPETSVNDEIEEHFDVLVTFPNPDEWLDKKRPR